MKYIRQFICSIIGHNYRLLSRNKYMIGEGQYTQLSSEISNWDCMRCNKINTQQWDY